MSTFGERLRNSRLAYGATQSMLAVSCGVTHVTLAEWEADTQAPSALELCALHAALHVSLDYLVCDESSDAARPASDDGRHVYRLENFVRERGKPRRIG